MSCNNTTTILASTTKTYTKKGHLQVTSSLRILQDFTVSSSLLHLRTFSLCKNTRPLQKYTPHALTPRSCPRRDTRCRQLTPARRSPEPPERGRQDLGSRSRGPQHPGLPSASARPRCLYQDRKRAPRRSPVERGLRERRTAYGNGPGRCRCAPRHPSPEAARLKRKTSSRRKQQRRRQPQAPLMLRSPGGEACQPLPPAGGPHGATIRENGRPLRPPVTQPRRRPGSGWRQESFRVTTPCPFSPSPLPPPATVASQPGRSANRVSPRSPVTQRAGSNHQLQQEEEGEERTTLRAAPSARGAVRPGWSRAW